ncbi:GRB10-interacting GYF protein 1-like [Salvelinus namaycush]|uniref:GRB10-interacting GYF protein 1-like n=1 Tax=Salvelinus namaycush TaxID=8040 RepID=A0A8U0PAS6_SALNM|nr:GRB10-interacting GYF protein 1-like [Salvelinus namaycush]
MTAETLNFGPECCLGEDNGRCISNLNLRLRALSRGRSVTSPPPSPALPKSKLADYRYGREEMLALYIKDDKPPEDITQDKEFAAILQDEPVQPLALEPLTEEEQRNFSMSVNSVAVLRLMGKGGGAAPAGVAKGRGGGIRGRGRGEGAFYQRAPGGPDDGEVGFGRCREMLRSQSWDDRAERPRFEKPIRRAEVVRPGFEEAGPLGRKDSWRADSDNWRTLREEEEEAAAGGGGGEQPAWRVAGTRRDDGGPRSAGWRDHGGRRKFEFDFRDSEGPRREDNRDGLPEWCTDEEDGEMGTFDSSGAFMCIKKGSKGTITEEDLEFEALEEDEENGQEGKDNGQEGKDNYKDNYTDGDECEAACEGVVKYRTPSPPAVSAPPSSDPLPAPCAPEAPLAPISHPFKTNHVPTEGSSPPGSGAQLSPDPSSSTTTSSNLMPPPSFGSLLPSTGGEVEEDEGMKHLQQEAEKMVASLQDTSLEEECFTQALQESHNITSQSHTHPAPHSHTHTAGHTHSHSAHRDCALPLSHEAAMKWFYKDPQAEIQGPFSTVEMCEWFQAGYFSMTLLVKRGCDEGFQPLGDVIKMWGRVPFSPGPSPPPLLVRQPPPPRGSSGNMDQELLKKQLEQAATAALYQQLQIRFQHMKRSGESSMMNRSMSVPDNGSMWDMRTSASQQSGGEANLWDLTMSHSTQGPSLEQLQKLQDRREAELRAKREEEERKRREEKRRQQEEQKRREEEELYRRKQQCRQQQELILKLLQRAQPGGPGCVSGSGSGTVWSGPQVSALSKQGKSLSLLELETERLLKQQAQHQRAQQQRDRHGGLSMGQWGEGSVGMWSGGGMEPKGSSGGMGVWEEAVKNQNSLRNMGMKNSRSSPSLSEQYMLRKKRTEEEDKLLKLLQGMKPQDGFTTWCEQMLHALNTSANNSPSSSLDVATIVAYLKEVESPYEVLDFIRSYLGDTVEAKEFAKQFLERRAKQKANHQRQQQQQQLSKEVPGLSVNNFPLQSMFQAAQMGKGGMYDSQAAKMKKQTMMLHSDPSILGYSFLGAGERMSLGEMETVEDY